jgi:hypothetical protein
VPKVDDAVTRIEAAVREAIQQQNQTVTKLLEDLGAGQAERTEQHRREFMDDIRRQVREAAEIQIGDAIREIKDKIDVTIAELRSQQSLSVAGDEPTKKNWSWLTLF